MRKSTLSGIAALVMVSALVSSTALAQSSQEDLAKAAQNPVANMISVPFQDNISFNYGPEGGTQNVLNIQPVWPFGLGALNLITRTILPVVSMPKLGPGVDSAFGLGDLNETVFFSPAKPGKVIWGAGPTITIPTATGDTLGTGKWSGGLGVVVLSMPGHWVLGVLVNNQWSFAGDSNRPNVNAMLLQYFVNYNFGKGLYFTSAPINTANWNASSNNRWVVPIGGGIGQIIPGKPPMNVSLQAYYNVVRPDNKMAGKWQLRLQLQLMFPKG
jgi:hypothetical protein